MACAIAPFAAMTLIALAISACDRESRQPAPSGSDHAGSRDAARDQNDQRPIEPVRIASFSPAISRTLVDLDLDHLIVGRTRFCDFLDASIAAVGDLIEIDFESLVRVRPTHVLVQPPASGVDPQLVDLCSRKGWRLATWHIDSIDEIETVVRELPDVLFASWSSEHAAATSKAAELLNEMAQSLSPRGEKVFTGPTLLVHHVDPVAVSGRGTYLHELHARLGGTNAVQSEGWFELTLEDVARMNPQAIVLVKPGAGVEMDVVSAGGALARMRIDAVDSQRIALLRHRDALMPSTAVANVAGELREILVQFARGAEGKDNSEPAP